MVAGRLQVVPASSCYRADITNPSQLMAAQSGRPRSVLLSARWSHVHGDIPWLSWSRVHPGPGLCWDELSRVQAHMMGDLGLLRTNCGMCAWGRAQRRPGTEASGEQTCGLISLSCWPSSSLETKGLVRWGRGDRGSEWGSDYLEEGAWRASSPGEEPSVGSVQWLQGLLHSGWALGCSGYKDTLGFGAVRRCVVGRGGRGPGIHPTPHDRVVWPAAGGWPSLGLCFPWMNPPRPSVVIVTAFWPTIVETTQVKRWPREVTSRGEAGGAALKTVASATKWSGQRGPSEAIDELPPSGRKARGQLGLQRKPTTPLFSEETLRPRGPGKLPLPVAATLGASWRPRATLLP